MKTVLEQQMEQDRLRKVQSREDRRSAMGGGVTFGPKETAQTIAYHQIRKKIDQDEVREDLLQQMHKEKNN